MKFWFGKKRDDNTESDSALAVQEALRPSVAFSTTPGADIIEAQSSSAPAAAASFQRPGEEAERVAPLRSEPNAAEAVAASPEPRPADPPTAPESQPAPATIVKLKAIKTPPPSAQANSHSDQPSFVQRVRPDLAAQPATPQASYGFKAREPLPSSAASDAAVPTQDELRAILRPKNNQKTIYDQFLNGLYDLVIIVDRHGHIVECNRRAETMLGYANRDDTWDMPISTIINGMTPPLFEQLKQSLASNDYAMINSRCVGKDGTTFPCEIGVSKTTFSGNNIVFSIRNSERHQAQEIEARQQKQALELALAPTFICAPQDGTFVAVNQAFLDAFGIPTRQAALDITIFDLMPNLRELFTKATTGTKVHEKMEIAAAAGQNIKIEIVLAPAFASNKTIHAVIGSLLQI